MVSEEKVYEKLTYRWQATQEIRAKFAEDAGKETFQIPIGSIYVHLDNLVNKGFAEMQERESVGDEILRRGGNPVIEYRKIGDRSPEYGLRRLITLPEKVMG